MQVHHHPLLTEQHSLLLFSLSGSRVIEITGLDAQTFLQGQLTCDVVTLNEFDSTLTAHCDAKGKTHSVFRLIKYSSEQFYLLFDLAILPEALDHLKKYAVFSKVNFSEKTLTISAIAGSQALTFLQEQGYVLPKNTNLVVMSNETALLKVEQNQPYYLLFSSEKPSWKNLLEFSQWQLFNLQCAIPMLTKQTQGIFLPQSLNLQWLERAISFRKGCYIGQEMVARAKFRGANRQAMYVLVGRSEQCPEINSEIEIGLEKGWRKTGIILNAINDQGLIWLQVILSNTLETNASLRLLQDQAYLCLYPLPYALESTN